MSRMLTLEQALALREGKRLVFTNGVFDILHAGHIDCLERARALGDLLIVGLNTDDSVRRLAKAPDRPINSLGDRATVLEALRMVDGVIPMPQDNPIELIRALQPEVHVKGGDYRADQLPESAAVLAYGGQVVILPLLPGRSTTGILSKIEGV